jgi:hypothetical protein
MGCHITTGTLMKDNFSYLTTKVANERVFNEEHAPIPCTKGRLAAAML